MEALGKDWVFAEGLTVALGKDFLRKNLYNFFAEDRRWRPSAETPPKGTALSLLLFFAEGYLGPWQRLCRVSDKEPSTKTLFADLKFSESSLPRAALSKAFAKGLWAFAESFGPSAKMPRPVVVREP